MRGVVGRGRELTECDTAALGANGDWMELALVVNASSSRLDR